MPSKVRDKDRDRDRDIPKKDRRRSSRSTRKVSSTKDRDKDSTMPARSSKTNSPSSKRRSSLPVPELKRRASSTSPSGSKVILPYPSFSKAHSKEAVGSREDVHPQRLSLYTPDPTDLGCAKEAESTGQNADQVAAARGEAPPSPPLTAMAPEIKREDSRGTARNVTIEVEEEGEKGGIVVEDAPRKPKHSGSKGSLRRLMKEDGSLGTSSSRRSTSSGRPPKPKPRLSATVEDSSSITKRTQSPSSTPSSTTGTATVTDSDATSVAPAYQKLQQQQTPDADDERSPHTDVESLPTPRYAVFPSIDRFRKETPIVDIHVQDSQPVNYGSSPMPPPPPPPPMMPMDIPRVDYLLQNGGLPHNVARNFLGKPSVPQSYQQYASPQLPAPAAAEVERIFAPFNRLLDDYTGVISKNGSLAVATGYRSVARRLLDRLEAVFARDISSETCRCVMCESGSLMQGSGDYDQGVSWGEVLELVSGRRELPQWPAFTIDPSPVGLGISTLEQKMPMQKLDIDVPDEFREHYLHQSRKTKQSVDRWLSSQPQNPSSPPPEIDDETLTFAMLTHLASQQRSVFTTLIGPVSSRPPSRAATPLERPRPELLVRTGLAIQRLYRLSSPPRDPESAMYLVNNPALHNVLATLAAISDGEWEVLTSGRFDGFLRSGAEDMASAMLSRTPSRGPGSISRTTTPSRPPANGSLRSGTPLNPSAFGVSRGPTPAPASSGAPVTMDEETEIAVLAEVEREIYLGMEALEDAFEALHCKAEAVRQALRQRGAGLSMASQARRGSSAAVEVRLGTPALGVSWESETDDGIDDGMSELAPDDSASNVSRSKRRRPKRRNERRTPALVEEDEESG